MLLEPRYWNAIIKSLILSHLHQLRDEIKQNTIGYDKSRVSYMLKSLDETIRLEVKKSGG